MNSVRAARSSPSLFCSILMELFRLADYYGEDDLKRRCEQQIRFLITADNFSQTYSASVLLDYKVKVTSIPLLTIKVMGSHCE